jgi:3-phenylpropionate/cinnamic acid dioxygenase small subunit
VIDAGTLATLDDLQNRYARALGLRDMRAWAACFDDPGSYVCTVRENVDQGLGIAMMMDDSSERIQDRVKYVTEVWKGTFEDYHCRHFVHRTLCSIAHGGLIAVESNVLVTYTDVRGRSGVLATGIYEDQIALKAEGARFRSKRVILDTTVTPRYLVYPL